MFGPEHMTAQSIAGLAALAVNEGRGNSMVWVEFPESHSHCGDYKIWYASSYVSGRFGPQLEGLKS